MEMQLLNLDAFFGHIQLHSHPSRVDEDGWTVMRFRIVKYGRFGKISDEVHDGVRYRWD